MCAEIVQSCYHTAQDQPCSPCFNSTWLRSVSCPGEICREPDCEFAGQLPAVLTCANGGNRQVKERLESDPFVMHICISLTFVS